MHAFSAYTSKLKKAEEIILYKSKMYIVHIIEIDLFQINQTELIKS